jgi:hydroxymethylpyrimidine pyrophosphatase-like HAD family hydrolase
LRVGDLVEGIVIETILGAAAMKFSVLALDYDGTIARDGRAHPAVLEAIREARARQIVIVLVTGRIMSDLRRVLAEQGLFDAIVAENGAVLAFPSRRTRLLGRPPSRASWMSFTG